MFPVWRLPLEKKSLLKVRARRYKSSKLSTKFREISSSLEEFPNSVKCDSLLKSIFIDETIFLTSTAHFWFETLELKNFSTTRKISKSTSRKFPKTTSVFEIVEIIDFCWRTWQNLFLLTYARRLNHYGSHCMKSVRIRNFSGPYFPAFGLNTDRYGISFRIQSECGKIRTRKTPNTDTFHAVSL